MNKYINTYRVSCEFDRRNLEPIKDDIFIVCSKSGQIYRKYNNTLAYYRPTRGCSSQLCDKLIGLGVKEVKNMSSDGDILIQFNENSIDIVAKEMDAITTGASIKPYSIKNLKKLKWFKENKQYYIDNGFFKELSEEEKEVFRERFKNNMQK